MTWEQKLAALQLLADTSVRMRKPGDWYVSANGRGICGDGFERGCYGNGKTPEAAVEDDWLQMTSIPFDRYIQTRKGRFRWNGYMWEAQEPPHAD